MNQSADSSDSNYNEAPTELLRLPLSIFKLMRVFGSALAFVLLSIALLNDYVPASFKSGDPTSINDLFLTQLALYASQAGCLTLIGGLAEVSIRPEAWVKMAYIASHWFLLLGFCLSQAIRFLSA